ncbi:hypothetical protein [Carboxylicivirga caseinilyticus]|uniref:hypothetical protein n=1 Tax=Carboxylicivirga caseinilyticus TaxID=3417572 RepID=UPI003D338482|nr:hypothetical protein [Marinilabiliaceae bacterium A049]
MSFKKSLLFFFLVVAVSNMNSQEKEYSIRSNGYYKCYISHGHKSGKVDVKRSIAMTLKFNIDDVYFCLFAVSKNINKKPYKLHELISQTYTVKSKLAEALFNSIVIKGKYKVVNNKIEITFPDNPDPNQNGIPTFTGSINNDKNELLLKASYFSEDLFNFDEIYSMEYNKF